MEIRTRYSPEAMTALVQAGRIAWKNNKKKQLFLRAVFFFIIFTTILFSEDSYTAFSNALSFCVIWALLRFFSHRGDKIMGWINYQNTPQFNKNEVTVLCTEDAIISQMPGMETKIDYTQIINIFETTDFFILLYSEKQGQVLDKNGFQSGSPDLFRSMIEEKTQLKIMPLNN